MTTNHQGLRLESHQGPTLAEPRMRLRRLRVALHALISFPGGQNTPTPESPWHDLTRNEPRATHPCEKERAMIANAIRQGCTTPDQVLSYYLVRLDDAMQEFSPSVRLADVCYVRLISEGAEAVEWQTKAKGLNTPETHERACRETEDVIGIAQIYVAGTRNPVSLGAPR